MHLFKNKWVTVDHNSVQYSYMNEYEWTNKTVKEPVLKRIRTFSLLNLIHDVKKLI